MICTELQQIDFQLLICKNCYACVANHRCYLYYFAQIWPHTCSIYPLYLICLIFKGPYPVTELKETKITTDAVTLVWEQPERKPHYSYLVQTSNSSISKNVSVTMSNITGLNSGTNYSFTVITRTADGTQSAPVTVSYFTRMYSIYPVQEKLNVQSSQIIITNK